MNEDNVVWGPVSMLSPGSEFSHYRITARLGAGGMGEVYLADDLTLGRQVAVKFMRTALSNDPERWNAFLNEARAAAGSDNPAGVAVHDAGVYRDLPYFVMEYVEGVGFDELIAGGPLPWQRAVAYAEQLCAALHSVHVRGIVHGDIKPSNLIIDRQNRLRLLDFGVARFVHDTGLNAQLSPSTVPYAAPEVIAGDSPSIASDLFAVGVVLYEATTGVRPFTGAYHAAIAFAIANETPHPPSELNPNIPASLSALIMRLLEKAPDLRYPDAEGVRLSLEELRIPDHGRRPLGQRVGRPWLWIAAFLVPVFAAVAWYQYGGRPGVPGTAPSLAVLEFENLGTPTEDYFAEGITDEVTVNLARNPRLRVISRNSALEYTGSRKSNQVIGYELGVDYLLRGTILWDRADSSRIRINASLIRVEDDAYVWTESFDRRRQRIFDLYRDVALAVSGALGRVVVTDSTIVPTSNLAAYDYYLRGNQYFYRSWERQDIEIAARLYRRAVETDSGFASAWAMLSRAEASMFWEYYDRSAAHCSTAFDAAHRAISLRADLSDGFLALGYCNYHCDRNYDQALIEFGHGLQHDPNNSELHNAVAAVRRRQGDFPGAVEDFVRALTLDPRSHLKAFDVALTFGMMRRYDSSEIYLERTISLAPDYALAHIYRAWLPIIRDGDITAARKAVTEASVLTDLSASKYYWWLLRILHRGRNDQSTPLTPASDTVAYFLFQAQQSRLSNDWDARVAYADSARVLLEQRLADTPDDPRYLSSLGLAYADLGDPDRAAEYAGRAVRLLPASKEAFDAPFFLLNLAEVCLIAGKHDEAVEQLEMVLSIPGFASASYLRADPLWTPLKDDPRFLKLLNRDG